MYRISCPWGFHKIAKQYDCNRYNRTHVVYTAERLQRLPITQKLFKRLKGRVRTDIAYLKKRVKAYTRTAKNKPFSGFSLESLITFHEEVAVEHTRKPIAA
jgi:hypothetical protein